MSKLDIITTLLAVLYLPVLIAASYASYRRGITRGKALGHDEASALWPQHSDYDDRLR
ncbi:hypothetical protein [Bradyrhizobium japonicum]|uniref:hypothetical protein n=1 Tax=Bradyrhizobium japonicum TaxID=375 RepID=UPI001BA8CEB3|nr:hypothetical protein [Bradyrhizobium japonicum]MBR0962223.1 hypothetical protein [Bradyrhizobium japonicum]